MPMNTANITRSHYFSLYQLVSWTLLYCGLMATLYNTPMFTNLEFFFAAALVGCSACYSQLIRLGYKRWAKEQLFILQLVYFAVQCALGASLSSLVLVMIVILASSMEILDPIAPNQLGYVVKHVFWGNAINMLLALVLWSAIYISIVNVRMKQAATQALASSQLETLIQQLNPHFLFNMLNNIRALILEDPHKAREALAQLSDMLRYSLHQFKFNKVPFQEELLVVEEYLSLCKIQFEQRLQYQFEIEEEVRSTLIPRMLLQLCVENAIKHGISQLPEGGTIKISASRIQNQLRLSISNPIPQTAQVQGITENQNNGVGLRNIRDRLKLLYPKAAKNQKADFDLDIDRNNQIAIVNISLPLEHIDEKIGQNECV